MQLLLPQNGDTSIVDEFVKLYPDFYENIDNLPKVIWKSCRRNILNQSAIVLVDYKALVESVKTALLHPNESKCSCEICSIASATINPIKSSFILQSKSKPGRPSLEPDNSQLPTDFAGLSQTEKIKNFMLFSPGTRDLLNIWTKKLKRVTHLLVI